MAWTPRHQELKEALICSKVLEPLKRSDSTAFDFVRHVVVEVEQRGDHGPLGKSLAAEVDWAAWVKRVAWLATRDGRHLECAACFLRAKVAGDSGGSGDQRGSGSDSDGFAEAAEAIFGDVLGEDESDGDVWCDCDELNELMSRQLSLKVALFASGTLGEPGGVVAKRAQRVRRLGREAGRATC